MVASLEGIRIVPYIPAKGTRILSINLSLVDHAEVMAIAIPTASSVQQVGDTIWQSS